MSANSSEQAHAYVEQIREAQDAEFTENRDQGRE